MHFRRYWGWVLLLGLAVAGCGGEAAPATSPPIPTATLPLIRLTPAADTPTPAVLAATPAPQPTTGPTPTPVVHVIAEGETLLEIAIQYGVTVEAIVAANPNVTPRLLAIGDSLLIPPAEEDPAAIILPAFTPVPLPLGPVSCYPTPVGGLHCLTTIENSGSAPITNLVVQISLADQAGTPLAVQRASSPLDVLYPGQTSPLGVLFSDQPGGEWQAVGLVISADEAGELAGRFAALEPGELQLVAGDSGARLTGRLSNSHASDVGQIVVVAALYLPDGQLRAFRAVALENAIWAGTSAEFEVLFTITGEEVSRVEVVALGRLGG